MLNKSDMRPAYAAVGQSSPASNNANINYAAFSASQTVDDDFNAFGDTSAKPNASAAKQKQSQNPQPKRSPQKKKGSPVPTKAILIGVAAVVALILIIALFAAIFSSPGKDILLEDNVYATYIDADDYYHVLANGKEIKHTFEGEVTLTPAKDRSFAYVFEQIIDDDGANVINMFILEGKKLSAIEAEADKIIACADYEPGIIFERDSVVQFYSEKAFEDISSHPQAGNFIVSGDASTVVYTEPTGKNSDTTQVKYFRNAGFNDIGETAGLVPVAISNDGKYVYATDSTNALYYLKITKRGAEYEQKAIVSSTSYVFEGVTAVNADGTEIIFSYNTNGTIGSLIYKIGDKSPTTIAAGKFYFTPSDNEVACPATFIDSAFIVNRTVTDEDGKSENITSTYYYTSKGAKKLADTTGQFSPDGKYFYYLDMKRLCRISLGSSDLEASKEELSSSVDNFAITEKGDIYTYTEATKNIKFRKSADSTSRAISSKADAKSMYVCGNSIYFSETINGDIKVYKSTDGATKEEITFKKTLFDSSIVISMGSGDKGYAYFTDTNGNTKLLYTSNGKTFDIICESCTVPGYSADISTPTTPGGSSSTGSDED